VIRSNYFLTSAQTNSILNLITIKIVGNNILYTVICLTNFWCAHIGLLVGPYRHSRPTFRIQMILLCSNTLQIYNDIILCMGFRLSRISVWLLEIIIWAQMAPRRTVRIYAVLQTYSVYISV